MLLELAVRTDPNLLAWHSKNRCQKYQLSDQLNQQPATTRKAVKNHDEQRSSYGSGNDVEREGKVRSVAHGNSVSVSANGCA